MKIKANKLIAVLCAVVMLVTTIVPTFVFTAVAADSTATLSFANKAQRTSFSTTKQVWTQNGITLTNDKSSSTTNVADYAAPVRFYASSKLTITAPGNITKIVFDCNNSTYATDLKNSIGATASASNDKVTVTPSTMSDTFVVAKLTKQVRVDSITVTYQAGCAHTNVNEEITANAECTKSGTKKVTCLDCGKTFDEAIPALGHTLVGAVCTRCSWEDTNYRAPSDDEIIFNFGTNSENKVHVDGNSISSGKTYTEKGYTLKFDSVANVYGGAYDAQGISALKLGTGSKAGSLTFTVPEDIAKVIIYVAAYKADSATVKVNNVSTPLTNKSNDGKYDQITVDTSTTKTVNFAVSSGYRCMINMIVFVKAPAHVHAFADATCTAPKTCSCGATEGEALGHDFADATCTAPKTCSVCGATEGETLDHDYADATCTAPKTCTVCGATEGEALGHTFVNSICACGAGSIEASFLQVQVREDGMADVRLVLTLTAEDLEALTAVGVYASLDKNEQGISKATTTVYETVNAGGKVVEAKEGTYFVLVEIINISNFDAKIYVTPFVATETTEALGAMVAFSVNQYVD